MKAFNVNMDEVVKFTAKLEKLGKTAFPVAVRATLNDAAFKTKQLVPKIAEKKFTTRDRQLFRVFSVVNKATGYDVNKMHAEVGINPTMGETVAEGLAQQELGGTIKGKKLIPHNLSRVSGSHSKRVQKKYHHGNVKVHDATRAYKYGNRSRKSRFAAAAFSASKAGTKYFLLKKSKGKASGTLFELQHLSSSRRTGALKLKIKPLFTYRDYRDTKVKATPYMAPAAEIARKLMPAMYKKNLEYQVNRTLK